MLPTKTCNFNWIGEQHYHCMLTFPYTKILKLLEFIDRSASGIEMKFMYYKNQVYEVL